MTDLAVVTGLPMIHHARQHPDRVVREMVRAGRWVRVRRGAYVDADWIAPPADRSPGRGPAGGLAARRRLAVARVAALSETGGGAPQVFTHLTAALVWGLPVWRLPEAAHVLVQGTRSRRAARDVVGHVMTVEPEHVVTRHGVQVTSLERTMLDVARSSPAVDALVVADAALRAGADRGAVGALVARQRSYRGIARAREVLGYADPGAESPWESVTRLHALAAGLPAPETQIHVMTHRGAARADMGWRDRRRLIEFDGRVKYTEMAAGDPARVVLEEKRREDAIAEQGWRILRLTSVDFRDPAALHHRLRAFVPTAPAVPHIPRPHLLFLPGPHVPRA